MKKLSKFYELFCNSFTKLLVLVILFASFQKDISACTTFVLSDKSNVVLGFSFDYHVGSHCIYVNKRNVERRRFLLLCEKPVKWISKYGSITFNLWGKDWPHSGINEVGLVVQCLGGQDEGAEYPHPDDRLPIDEPGWVQYQLDNSANIQDVIENMKKIRISNKIPGNSHHLICDSTGSSMIIDYVNGETKIYTGNNLPYPITANDTYPHMLNYLKQHKGYGGNREFKFKVDDSICRFVYVTQKIKEYKGQQNIIDYTFDILKNLRQPQDGTRYQVVYDIKNLTINYNISPDFAKIKSIYLKDFNFTCNEPVLMTEIRSDRNGNIKDSFYEFNSEKNKEVILNTLEQEKDFNYIPKLVFMNISNFAEKSNCYNDKAHKYSHKSSEIKDCLRKLKASLHEPSKTVLLLNTKDNSIFTVDIELNDTAPMDLYFSLEIPQESTCVPVYHVFILPNPLIIRKGEKSTTAKVILISSHFEIGTESKLIINLSSEQVSLGDKKQIVINIKRES